MRIEFTAQGIYLPEIDLWLDPQETRGAAWLSHAHADHARGWHGLAMGTRETLRLYRLRWPEEPLGARQELRAVRFGETVEFRGAKLTALPASHILGAAQLLVELGGERLVYTGDIKLREPLLGAATEVARCDRLIIESTFGLPLFHFLDREAARRRMVDCARETLEAGAIPVFVGYALGRGQEIVHTLCEAGLPVAVHGAIARLIPVYVEAGYAFTGWAPYDARTVDGKALVVTPGFPANLEAAGKNIRLIYVSGWAALANARARMGAEELIPYSDHGDFGELTAMVERSGARVVDVVHGYTEAFAAYLRRRGVEATARGAAGERTAEDEEGGGGGE